MNLKLLLIATVVAAGPSRAVDIVNDPIHTGTNAFNWVLNYAEWITQIQTQYTQIENYVSGGTAADQNRTTWTTYTADGQVKTLTASNADTGNQQTKYDYGTTLSNSGVASSQLLRWVTYPDVVGTGGDFVTYSYNDFGQQTHS